MPLFHKSKPPMDVSVSTPTPPAELVQDLASCRNSQTLTVSSTTIALSISSGFHDIHETSSNGAIVQGMDMGWQTAYAAVRMAVETIKESSDLCLPLKAVIGAVYVLMKNYDVSVLLEN